jgi:Tfp pilus assembly protein PilN
VIRINLLPPEITEKRKAEQRWVYVIFGAVAFYALLFIFFGVMWLQVSAAEADVAGKQQEAQSLQAQAGSFKVFEDRQADLVARKQVADKALAGRIAWSRLMRELALVLPADAWLTEVHADEKTFTMKGMAVDGRGDMTSMGFKPVAKLLVRMADLDQLQNVWLETSKRGEFLDKPVVEFSLGADVVTSSSTTARVSAPPTQQ